MVRIAALTLGMVFIVQLALVFGARRFAYPHLSGVDVAQKPALAVSGLLLALFVAQFATWHWVA